MVVGETVTSTVEATNPRTGVVDYRVDAADSARVQATAERLRQNQVDWVSDSQQRVVAMRAWADALEGRSAQMIDALVADTGRRMLSFVEAGTMVERIRYWAERFPAVMERAMGEGRSVSVANVNYRHQLVPYSLVGVISPWNFPLTLSLVDAIPALCAGSAVLLKPSEVTPRFAAVLKASIDDVGELAKVFDVVVGDGDTGQSLIDAVDMVCFTGSVATGRKVAVRAAENFIPACLELGGKDPAIVLEDADVGAAADAILRSAAGGCGQACMSVERIYVHEARFDEFREALVERARAQTFNTPDLKQGSMPPFIDQRQAGKVEAQLSDAIERGAVLHSGGPPECIDGGYWMAPTVLSNVTNDMLLMRDETFGPLLPLMPFSNDDQGLAMANASDYGLSGCVFGEQEHALTVAAGLDVGAVGINDASMTALIHDVEKQSFRYSGMGPSRMGDMGFLRFFRRKALLIQNDPPAPMAVLDESGIPG